MSSTFGSLLPMLFRVILPAVLASAGTTLSVLNSEAFRAFCGLN